jgi:hypothetical protein
VKIKSLLLILALVPVSSGAQPPTDRARTAVARPQIGRIFFSPSQRRRRDEDKNGSATEASNTAAAARSERLVVNGAVSSSARGRAVWVNGAPIENSAQPSSAWADRSGNVFLRDEQRVTRRVQPGQTVDALTGTVEDLLPSGSVRAGTTAKPR